MNEATKKLIQLLVVEDYLVFHKSKSLLQKILDKEITNYLDIYYELVDFPNQERDWYHLLDDVGALEMYQEIIADDCFLDEVVEENDDYDQFYLKLIDSVSFRQEKNNKELFCKDFSSFLELLFCNRLRSHFFLLDLVVDDVAGGQLPADFLRGDAGFRHQHQGVVHQVCNLVDGLPFVLSLSGDDHLGTFLPDFFQNLIKTLPEEVGGVGALRQIYLPLLEQCIKVICGKRRVFCL